ncbi:MAG TPA: hypothetical protein VGF80_01155 [Galbitalea sp.]|jgi:threonine dehydrogenase-like Zn-dependent dehydrogenase
MSSRHRVSLDDLVAHTKPLDAAEMYEALQKKEDGCIKVLLKP